MARVLGGYAVLMALVQLRFLPFYRQLHFSPGFWAFTFSYAAAAGDALEWLRISAAPGRTALSIVLLALVTGLVLVIAARTARLALRGQLLPAPARAGHPAAGRLISRRTFPARPVRPQLVHPRPGAECRLPG